MASDQARPPRPIGTLRAVPPVHPAVTVDLDQVHAIDVHVHAERNADQPPDPVTTELLEAAARYFGGSPPQPTAQDVADYYRERNLLAVIFNVDDEAGMGRRRLGNDEVLEVARADGSGQLLVPLVSDAVRTVDVERKQIDVDLAFLGEQ